MTLKGDLLSSRELAITDSELAVIGCNRPTAAMGMAATL